MVRNKPAATIQALLRDMVGTYLPKGTSVLLSTDQVEPLEHFVFPYLLIHPSNGIRGQTHMLAAATRRTIAFFLDNGASQELVDSLKIVHVSSTRSSSRSQFMARDNDKLLSPGFFSISPLTLTVLQSTQLPFPKAGRWVVENDSFFLLGRPLETSGDELCLLAIERPTSGASLVVRCFSRHPVLRFLVFRYFSCRLVLRSLIFWCFSCRPVLRSGASLIVRCCVLLSSGATFIVWCCVPVLLLLSGVASSCRSVPLSSSGAVLLSSSS